MPPSFPRMAKAIRNSTARACTSSCRRRSRRRRWSTPAPVTIDETGSDRFTTSDKNEVLVNTVIKYRVADPLKLFESNEKNTQTAQERLTALARTALASAFTKRTLNDALAGQQALASEAQKAIEQPASSFGVELVDLQLTRIDFPPAVADSVYKRMIAARQQAAADERARGHGRC